MSEYQGDTTGDIEHPGGERRSFVGIARGRPGENASLADALDDAAGHAVREGAVTPDEPVWYDVAIEVQIGNQHVKTLRATLTPRD